MNAVKASRGRRARHRMRVVRRRRPRSGNVSSHRCMTSRFPVPKRLRVAESHLPLKVWGDARPARSETGKRAEARLLAFARTSIEAYRLHRGQLVDYAASIVGDRARGEDIVQEAFIRLDHAMALREIGEPLGYLRRIVRNLALDWRRRHAGELRLFDTGAEVEEAVDERPSLDEELAQREQLRILVDALGELPERTRRALEMHRFEGLKLREIAARLDISVSLAHALVFQGLDHCRRRLVRRS